MFFYTYNKLSPEQISEKLGSSAQAVGVSPFFEGLAGKKLHITLDDGVILDLDIACAECLTVSENGGEPREAKYRAMKLQNCILISFLISGDVKGWNIVIEHGVRRVTAFETWFCGYADSREVQREIHYGYVDCNCGEGDPGSRHTLTNRLECKGLYWKDDTGVEILNFFPSVCYSSLVEISNPRGGITVCAPSDFIKISDRMYVYSRVECEFSGTMVLEVIDMMQVEAIGVRLGFDENDALDYRMYRAKGEVTGQGATFEKMTDYGTELAMGGPFAKMKKKGMRAVYRPAKMHKDYTYEEVQEMGRKNLRLFHGTNVMKSENIMEESDYMVGRTFKLRYDNGGPVWEYEVTGLHELKWRYEGETEWHEEEYRAYEPAPDIILFSHFLSCEPDFRNVTNAVDFQNGLTTCIDAHLGTVRHAWEADHRAIFGVLEAEGVEAPLVRRHELTKELTGKSFAWSYSEEMTSIHVYSSPESYSWTIFLNNGSGGLMWSSPCIYVKLRDDAYLMSWCEDNCNGNQGTFVFNPNIMHDAGFFYGVEDEGIKVNPFGAYARTCGSFDILKYFDQKNRR